MPAPRAFADRFRALMQDPETLDGRDPFFEASTNWKVIYEALGRVGSYAGLLYAADTANPEYQDLDATSRAALD